MGAWAEMCGGFGWYDVSLRMLVVARVSAVGDACNACFRYGGEVRQSNPEASPPCLNNASHLSLMTVGLDAAGFLRDALLRWLTIRPLRRTATRESSYPADTC